MRLVVVMMLAIVLVGTCVSKSVWSAELAFPRKPIRIITPYPPGGANSMLARILGQKLTESWGQAVIVDNRPGAGTIVGTDALVKALPDGYTFMLAGGNLVLVPLLFPAPYDPIKDLMPVATFARSENVLVIGPTVPVEHFKDLISYAKSKPGQLNYATPGAGSTQHLAHELLNLVCDIKTHHIPYKGAGPALLDLIAGQVQLYFATTMVTAPYVQSGKLKALGITGTVRSPLLLATPTFSESGVSGFESAGTWFGVIAPARVPLDIVDKMSRQMASYMNTNDFKETLTHQGLTSFYSTPTEFKKVLYNDRERFSRIIKSANIKMDH
jgi:tripartite-type tricarboxylate transporter receptor subunit TctC